MFLFVINIKKTFLFVFLYIVQNLEKLKKINVFINIKYTNFIFKTTFCFLKKAYKYLKNYLKTFYIKKVIKILLKNIKKYFLIFNFDTHNVNFLISVCYICI